MDNYAMNRSGNGTPIFRHSNLNPAISAWLSPVFGW
jgi:hypothetical protein